jgi:RimJ/RimL family protein N-acetyltransferase
MSANEPVPASETGDGPWPLAYPRIEPARVPRRFGIGVLMILVTMFAVLFAMLNVMRVDPRVFAIIGVLFVGVVAAQVLLFEGRSPRKASAAVGAVLFPIEVLVVLIIEQLRTGDPDRSPLALGLFGLVCTVPAGALFGYLAGGLTAGVFLALNRFRSGAGTEPLPPLPEIELRPLTAEDIATLLGWLAAPPLRERWAMADAVPLEADAMGARLAQAAAAEGDLKLLKAVDAASGAMLAYVELAQIDRRHRAARLQYPLVAPDVPQRAELSMMLLDAVLRYAFRELRLHRVEVLVLSRDSEALECYRRVGFWREGTLRDGLRASNWYLSPELLSILAPDWAETSAWRKLRRLSPPAPLVIEGGEGESP